MCNDLFGEINFRDTNETCRDKHTRLHTCKQIQRKRFCTSRATSTNFILKCIIFPLLHFLNENGQNEIHNEESEFETKLRTRNHLRRETVFVFRCLFASFNCKIDVGKAQSFTYVE